MTEQEAVQAITAEFLDQWIALHPDDVSDPDYCPVAPEGEYSEAPDTWVRLTIVPMFGEQRSMGGPSQRRVSDGGMIAVEVFVGVNIGITKRAELCDDVRAALQLKNLTVAGDSEPLRIFKGVSKNPTTDGRWLTQTVVLEYEYMGIA